MMRLPVLLCLICAASAEILNPRGARPVEPATRSESCAAQKEWPFCTTDDWGPRCPSGCRIQGLMDTLDHDFLKRIEKIRGILDQNKVKHRTTDTVSKQTYDYLKDKLTTDADQDHKYYDLAQNLRQRITDMKIKIDRQLRILAALKDRVKDQVADMKRLEVDIDIKLRSCKGSCSESTEYQVDLESYQALDKQVKQLESQAAQGVESVATLHVMKSRTMEQVTSDLVFKSGFGASATKSEDVFPSVKNVQLYTEEEGSPSSPASVTKDPDCVDANKNHVKGEQDGLFKIRVASQAVVEVYCQQEGLMGGWVLVQQRESGALAFNRSWADYRHGFGSVNAQGKGELWLGNENLHLLTNQGETMMRVVLHDGGGRELTAEYTVQVGSEGEGYALRVSGYAGDAGDALAAQHGRKFSTFDKDQDPGDGRCAFGSGGGWWCDERQGANLNAAYDSDLYRWSDGVRLTASKVFIRSTAF